jgi:serine/threonine protein kinase
MLDPEQLVGEKIKQYRIDAHIDRGGMADVYLAFDENLHRRVALKIMLPAFAHDRQFVERFWREARTAAGLDHPHIVQVYEIDSTPDQRPYIAMQYIEGGSLKDKLLALGDGSMPVDTALTILRQVALALGVAHDAHIVHRDIKPSNILLRTDGTPVLVDLGIAAVQTGIVLYEMLCGTRPFEATDSLAILHKHVYEEPEPLPNRRTGLTQQTYRLVDICLQKDPNQRYQTAGELVSAIDRALAAERGELPSPKPPISEPTVPMPAPTIDYPARKRPPVWLWALLPLLLIAIGTGAYFAFFANGDDEPAVTPTTAVEFAVDVDTPDSPPTAPPTSEPVVQTAVVTATPGPPTETPSPTETLLPTDTPLPTETPDLGPETLQIGSSVQNKPIEAVRFGAGENVIMLIGGLHAGAAPSTVSLAQRTVNYFRSNLQLIPDSATLYVIISVSPDSPTAPGELIGRLNANGVDLNRNWDCRWVQDAKWRGQTISSSGGPSPLSEPETQALAAFIQQKGADAVVFWEARAANGLSSPGACGDRSLVSGRLAQIYGLAAGYPIADFENLTDQEVNGDATNWLDLQGIPAIAVLLPDYDDVDWNNSLAGTLAVLQEYGQ